MGNGYHILQTILFYFIVYSFAIEDFIYVYGEGNKEMAEQGRVQYQIIRERGLLPKYGSCWRAALENLNEGCRYLSEDTQSDIALHITNCFLEMSGHETYNCQLDKKTNLRAICINNMSDRAFNVYTEFYTHTQNICWFLRGQIWHETIAENTLKVGKQLEVSVENQQDLIKIQKESIELQERMLQQGKFLEKVLEDIYISSETHKDLLKLLAQSVVNLQSWVIGEISWIDSIIFNILAVCLILLLTSSQRTATARLPLVILLILNLIIERFICSFYTQFTVNSDTEYLYNNIYSFVWYSRYAFTFFGTILYLYILLTYHDVLQQNLCLLNTIKKQNNEILNSIDRCRRSKTPSVTSTSIDFISESRLNFKKPNHFDANKENEIFYKESSIEPNTFHSNFARKKVLEAETKRYNLRTRQGTPDSGVVH